MSKGILVCVTAQKECERLIRAGAALAREKGEALCVLHVSTSLQLSSLNRAETLNLLFALSREAGAVMETVESDRPEEVILDRCRDGGFDRVVLGEGPGNIAEALRLVLGKERVTVV